MDLLKEAKAYFASRAKDFWHWADQYQVIEGLDGRTICYRQDLLEVLKGLQGDGLPPLELIVLVLAACRKEWHMTDFSYLPNEQESFGKYHFPFVKDSPEEVAYLKKISDELHDQKILSKSILQSLLQIHRLPEELRSGARRIHLLKSILKLSDPLVEPGKADFFVREFESGRIPEARFIAPLREDHQLRTLWPYLSPLKEIEDLEAYLRTGLPSKLKPLTLPDLPEPEEDLLTQLAKNPETAGLARLAKRLVAALRIPVHTRGASEQPIGGVSDISNRGNFDRLLLSELANDNDTLTARLVNNEALYLRRETPPDPQVQERVILVDVSLRLWGIPKLFALAAALGCAINNHQQAKIKAFALGDKCSEANPLSNPEEVVRFLEMRSPAINPHHGLTTFFKQHHQTKSQSIFFITSEDVLADSAFRPALGVFLKQMDFLLVVSRNGSFSMYKMVNGHHSLLNTSKFDLEEILFSRERNQGLSNLLYSLGLKKATPKRGDTVTFLPQHPGKLQRENFAAKGNAVVAVLPCKRVWFWHSKEKGAIELMNGIRAGIYNFFFNAEEVECILVSKSYLRQPNYFCAYLFQQNELTYVIDTEQKELQHFPSGQKSPLEDFLCKLDFHTFSEGKFFLSQLLSTHTWPYERAFFSFDPASNSLSPWNEAIPSVLPYIPSNRSLSLSPVKNITNNGYSVLRNVKRFGVIESSFFHLDHFVIKGDGDKLWFFKDELPSSNQKYFVNWTALDQQFHTKNILFQNGYKIVLDSRGFLLFFKPNSTIPDLTITLILGKEIAAWTSDGYFTGNPYFYTALDKRIMPSRVFYPRFIEPIIKNLI